MSKATKPAKSVAPQQSAAAVVVAPQQQSVAKPTLYVLTGGYNPRPKTKATWGPGTEDHTANWFNSIKQVCAANPAGASLDQFLNAKVPSHMVHYVVRRKGLAVVA